MDVIQKISTGVGKNVCKKAPALESTDDYDGEAHETNHHKLIKTEHCEWLPCVSICKSSVGISSSDWQTLFIASNNQLIVSPYLSYLTRGLYIRDWHSKLFYVRSHAYLHTFHNIHTHIYTHTTQGVHKEKNTYNIYIQIVQNVIYSYIYLTWFINDLEETNEILNLKLKMK